MMTSGRSISHQHPGVHLTKPIPRPERILRHSNVAVGTELCRATELGKVSCIFLLLSVRFPFDSWFGSFRLDSLLLENEANMYKL